MENKQDEFAFGKKNYQLLIAATAIIILGYFLMSGGGAENPNEFHYDEIFSPIRITVAPILVLGGFVLGIFAIMKKAD
ncbi:DUF3098 domain-containing protein [Acidiluteibacter ferrifornacis]|jgi:DUF3098 family protein|uniref:DUF3098 domain-containing protein n=1 Tax=Acidiluteibacter ferrifornacis TaxID=2692424 RepID=A0A6N9NHE8_9FLAO|nr:DUF3098 domain-containing protein [Acidiluteibacter ferrifornacis]MBR9830600.1 DUF3098 domain-containing protein [bacterium]NBG64617.1 DUF3098 domain-containing protein [Acidiluteibacter ferrifornacis]